MHLELLGYPTFVALNETKLDKGTEAVTLAGYTLLSRRDRGSRHRGGGVACFVRNDAAQTAVLLEHSEEDERSWHLVHTAQGPVLLGVWYRPPCPGEVSSVDRLEQEWLRLSESALGTVLVGDCNVHHARWLRHSTGTTPEGKALYYFCTAHGLEERVRKPTRGENLLDLVLTDLHGEVQCTVQPKLADHQAVLVNVQLNLPKTVTVQREYWLFNKADWTALQRDLEAVDWDQVLFEGENEATPELADEAVERFTNFVLTSARKHVPSKTCSVRKSTHPWLNDRCRELVRRKQEAENTPLHRERLLECSQGVLEEYRKYVQRTREKMRKLPRSSKRWWKLSKALSLKAEKTSSVPPLKRTDGTWAREAGEKAELFLDTFAKKYTLPPEECNRFTTLLPPGENLLGSFLPVRARTATQVLKALNEDKSTGPDALSAKVLKRCAKALGRPVAKLARLLLNTRRWPKLWRLHWVFPLYKKRSVYDSANYRGIHLSAQLSKVVERLLGRLFLPFLEATGAYGPNQWAYRKQRGCKDALAANALQWVWWLHCGRKVGLYCSDVSGAFDRVRSERLAAKLENLGVGGQLLGLVKSWLEEREAVVVVDGSYSRKAKLHNMVYQGTVWGPPLWNCYFSDARCAVNGAGFLDTFFADDLNCFRDFLPEVRNEAIVEELELCQAALHTWGAANQVEFDAGKESLHVLHRRDPAGDSFRILGVLWDTKLLMDAECEEVGARASWKLTTLLRARSFYDLPALVQLYKAHVLPTLEFPTPAVYHASTTTLERLDRVQKRFCKEVGLDPGDALWYFNLAPLQTRRDVALLGLVHRTVLGLSPPQFSHWFFAAPDAGHSYRTRLQAARHTRQLYDYLQGDHTELLRRSLLGLPRVYNSLPQETVDQRTVSGFQRKLQEQVKGKLQRGEENWENCLNLRAPSLRQRAA